MAELRHQIFISYSRQDGDVARRLVAALGACDWTVFLDERMPGGVDWRAEIDAAVDSAKVVIVLWSVHSKNSSYVAREATRADMRGTLVPVRIEPVDPPPAFKHIQSIDLSDWTGGDCPPALIATVAARLDGAPLGIVESVDTQRHRQLLDAIARERGVPLAALTAQLARLGELEVSVEQVPARIETFVTEFLKLKTDFSRATNAGPEITSAHRRALSLLNTGDLDEARRLFDSMILRVRERRQQTAHEEATLLSERARIDRLQVRYSNAIAAYQEAAELMHFDAEATVGHLASLVDTLIRQGDEFGDNAALHRAIEIVRTRVLPLVPRTRQPLDWARAQHGLATALIKLGERETEMDSLEDAVRVCRLALEECTRERAPLDWAAIQHHLGHGLWALAERKGGTAHLEEAVAALRAALKERTRQRVPLDWARTQNVLGNALLGLGRLRRGSSHMEHAVAAYRAALMEYTRERLPLYWAMMQNNLAVALHTLGLRERGTDRLEEAVVAYRAALQGQPRERVPLEWAMAQNNLGIALCDLAERESGTGRLEEAVVAFREALKERTPERSPYHHERTKQGLNIALALLAERGASRRDPNQHVSTAKNR